MEVPTVLSLTVPEGGSEVDRVDGAAPHENHFSARSEYGVN